MSINIPTHYVTEYSRNIDLLLQQKDSRLSAFVTSGQHTGEKASPVDQFGAVEMQDVSSRFSPMNRIDAPTDRRWVFPTSSDLSQLIDSSDKLKLLTDPQSAYVQNAVAAANRRKDRHILSSFFGTAYTGVNAGTSETFGTDLTTAATPGQNVGVNVGGTTSNLNVAKLKAAAKRFMEADVDVEAEGGIHVAINAANHDALVGEIQIIGREFGVPIFDNNKLLARWWIFNFHHTELLTTGTDDQAGTSTQTPAWVRSGMHLGMFGSQVTDIDRRKDLQGIPIQVYLMVTMGATRLEKEKIIRIWTR